MSVLNALPDLLAGVLKHDDLDIEIAALQPIRECLEDPLGRDDISRSFLIDIREIAIQVIASAVTAVPG